MAIAAEIVDFLAEKQDRAGVQQIADALGMTKSRASRHLANLETLGLVSRSSVRQGYQLGWRVLRWGYIASARIDFTRLFASSLADLGTKLNRTVLLCAPANGDAIVLSCRPSGDPIRIDVEVGLVLSLPFSPSAMVAYAFMPRERRLAMLQHLQQRDPEFRIVDECALQSGIAELHRRYFFWADNKYDVGYGAIAAPIFDREERLVAIVTIMLSSRELLGSKSPPGEVVQKLLDCCESCSHRLGSHIRFPAAA